MVEQPLPSSAPLGVFDSGLGGLTVVAELIRQLPNESIIYFGDTARLPYGPKSPETVLRYSREIAAFLMSQKVKAIVVACNTATAHALTALQRELPIPVLGVIEPGARAAVRHGGRGAIGVIGTRGTIASRAYETAIKRLRPEATVLAQACPLFVPLIEEGWADSPVAAEVATEYLTPMIRQEIQALVLGCTHYPLLKPLLGELLGSDVRLIDSAEETAAETRSVLEERGMLRTDESNPNYRFIASDQPGQLLELGRRFLGSPIDRVETLLLG